MKRIQSFPIGEYEKANKFMELHAPRSTPQQSGVVFHNGNIVIIWDDGKEHASDKVGFYKHLLEGDREKLWIVEQSIENTKIALADIKPKWYVDGMSKTDIRKKLEEEAVVKKDKEGKEYIPTEQVDELINQITNLENQDRMDKHEFNRLTREVKAYENLLKKLDGK